MIISRKLKASSVANYLLYMWHQEDIIRAMGLDIEKIKSNIVAKYDCDEKTRGEIAEWYDNLIAMMRNEGKEASGHLDMLRAELESAVETHNRLLQTPNEIQYNAKFFSILPALREFRAKNGSGAEVSDIELCLTAIYEVSLMKMSGKEVSEETEKAVKSFGEFLNVLGAKYNEEE